MGRIHVRVVAGGPVGSVEFRRGVGNCTFRRGNFGPLLRPSTTAHAAAPNRHRNGIAIGRDHRWHRHESSITPGATGSNPAARTGWFTHCNTRLHDRRHRPRHAPTGVTANDGATLGLANPAVNSYAERFADFVVDRNSARRSSRRISRSAIERRSSSMSQWVRMCRVGSGSG